MHECCMRLPSDRKWDAERMQEEHGRDARGMHHDVREMHKDAGGCTRAVRETHRDAQGCPGDAWRMNGDAGGMHDGA